MWNQTGVYQSEIAPLIKQLQILCKDYSLPMFCTVAVAETANGTVYRSEVLDADFVGAEISDDKIKEHLKITRGFKTVYPSNVDFDELDMDELQANQKETTV